MLNHRIQLSWLSIGNCADHRTGMDCLRFLTLLNRSCHRRGPHIIFDNSSTHTAPDVQSWLQRHPNVQFPFTPTGASWLNMVEAWFGTMTRRSARQASFRSVTGLVTHITHYIDHWNDNPLPFAWAKTPAAIIRKAVRRGR